MSAPDFWTVYKDMGDLVNFVGQSKDVSFLVDGMNTCGGMWVTWKRRNRIPHTGVHDFFKILNNVMRIVMQTVQKERPQQRVPDVYAEHLAIFLKSVYEQIQEYPDQKKPDKLFTYVEGLFCLYKSPELKLAMLRAKAAVVRARQPVASGLKHARIASLLSELQEMS